MDVPFIQKTTMTMIDDISDMMYREVYKPGDIYSNSSDIKDKLNIYASDTIKALSECKHNKFLVNYDLMSTAKSLPTTIMKMINTPENHTTDDIFLELCRYYFHMCGKLELLKGI